MGFSPEWYKLKNENYENNQSVCRRSCNYGRINC